MRSSLVTRRKCFYGWLSISLSASDGDMIRICSQEPRCSRCASPDTIRSAPAAEAHSKIMSSSGSAEMARIRRFGFTRAHALWSSSTKQNACSGERPNLGRCRTSRTSSRIGKDVKQCKAPFTMCSRRRAGGPPNRNPEMITFESKTTREINFAMLFPFDTLRSLWIRPREEVLDPWRSFGPWKKYRPIAVCAGCMPERPREGVRSGCGTPPWRPRRSPEGDLPERRYSRCMCSCCFLHNHCGIAYNDCMFPVKGRNRIGWKFPFGNRTNGPSSVKIVRERIYFPFRTTGRPPCSTAVIMVLIASIISGMSFSQISNNCSALT